MQVVACVDDKTVSRGMVGYMGALQNESIVDVEGIIVEPKEVP